jgi:hypothetical protein
VELNELADLITSDVEDIQSDCAAILDLFEEREDDDGRDWNEVRSQAEDILFRVATLFSNVCGACDMVASGGKTAVADVGIKNEHPAEAPKWGGGTSL